MTRPPPTARRVAIVAPHPDDEAIGAWALIRHYVAAGTRVDVVIVSDGGGSHPGSRRWPRARLARERQRETRRALASLAVPAGRIRFLGLPDGALDQEPVRIRRGLAKALLRQDLIVGPVATDAHADHRAVALALAHLPRRGEQRLGYHVWPVGAGAGVAGCQLRLDNRALCAKRRVIRGYRTQMGLITDAHAGFTMSGRQLAAFVRPVERFVSLA